MKMTRPQFVDTFKYRLAGMALYGVIDVEEKAVMARMQRVFEMPAEIEKLLGQMYDSLKSEPVPPSAQGAKK